MIRKMSKSRLLIIGDFPGHFLDLTLCFVQRAFHFVLRAGFHGIPPSGFRFLLPVLFSLNIYFIRLHKLCHDLQ